MSSTRCPTRCRSPCRGLRSCRSSCPSGAASRPAPTTQPNLVSSWLQATEVGTLPAAVKPAITPSVLIPATARPPVARESAVGVTSTPARATNVANQEISSLKAEVAETPKPAPGERPCEQTPPCAGATQVATAPPCLVGPFPICLRGRRPTCRSANSCRSAPPRRHPSTSRRRELGRAELNTSSCRHRTYLTYPTGSSCSRRLRRYRTSPRSTPRPPAVAP